MTLTLLVIIACCSYLGSSLFIIKSIKKQDATRFALYLAWLGVFMHSVYHIDKVLITRTVPFGFFNTASMVFLLVALILLIAAINKPVEKLGIVLFPMAGLMLCLSILFPESSKNEQAYDWKMLTHIFTSIFAFSLLNIAAFQACMLATQDYQLRKHNPGKLISSLPPLQTMESLLFQMIATGVFFLSISLVSGFIFVEDLFAQHLGHKTILSILAWIIFCGLLLGRRFYGWRGQTAIRWTLFGFASLLLAYFGSKLVYEFILNKN